MDPDYLYKPSSGKTKKPHKCNFSGCSARFSRPHKLESHIRKHKGERPFQCDFPNCSKTYTNSSHLKRHKITAHENVKEDKEYICSEKGCKLVFANIYSLQKHLSRFHSQDNFPFKCTHCPKKFKKRKSLSEHVFSTHNRDPFKCESCQLGFSSLTLYTKHKTNHRIFTCDCEKEFDRWSNFCKHRRTDCPLKQIEHPCIICKKTFQTKRNLRAHCLKIHVEESQTEVYRCPYLNCKRSYQYKRNLYYHIAFYHEKTIKDVEIKCTHANCNVIFKAERFLHKHLKLVHGEKIKIQKPKKPRKDKGKKKFCMASLLSGIPLSSKEHLEILKSDHRLENNSINLSALQISVPKIENWSARNHISKALKLGPLTGTIKIPKTENHLKGKILVVVVKQDPIFKMCRKKFVESVEDCNVATSDNVDVHLVNSEEVTSKASIEVDTQVEQLVLTEEVNEFCEDMNDSVILEKCEELLSKLSQMDSPLGNTINEEENIENEIESYQRDIEVDESGVRIVENENTGEVQALNETEVTNYDKNVEIDNLPPIFVEMDVETERMLIDTNSDLNNVELLHVTSENTTHSDNDEIVQKYIKILKVNPSIEDIDIINLESLV